MLFVLGLGCSLLAGFGMAASAGRSRILMLTFAGTVAVALYIVTDMEYPRLGLIRIENFDHFLADAYDQMRWSPEGLVTVIWWRALKDRSMPRNLEWPPVEASYFPSDFSISAKHSSWCASAVQLRETRRTERLPGFCIQTTSFMKALSLSKSTPRKS